MLYGPVSLPVTKGTSCDGLSSRNKQDQIQSCTNIYVMFVMSLSNISIKTNFKQITRVEIRLTNLYNTLR